MGEAKVFEVSRAKRTNPPLDSTTIYLTTQLAVHAVYNIIIIILLLCDMMGVVNCVRGMHAYARTSTSALLCISEIEMRAHIITKWRPTMIPQSKVLVKSSYIT